MIITPMASQGSSLERLFKPLFFFKLPIQQEFWFSETDSGAVF